LELLLVQLPPPHQTQGSPEITRFIQLFLERPSLELKQDDASLSRKQPPGKDFRQLVSAGLGGIQVAADSLRACLGPRRLEAPLLLLETGVTSAATSTHAAESLSMTPSPLRLM